MRFLDRLRSIKECLRHRLRFLDDEKKCQWTTTDLAEVMKYEKMRRSKDRSVASHANSNAVMVNVGESQKIQETTRDALESMGRGLHGRM